MEIINKYWKKFVIILFVCFSLTTCVKNCSKSNEIRNNNKVIDSISLLISEQNKVIDSLNFEIKSLTMQKDLYKSTSESYKSSLDKASSKRTAITVNVPKEDKKENE